MRLAEKVGITAWMTAFLFAFSGLLLAVFNYQGMIFLIPGIGVIVSIVAIVICAAILVWKD